MRERRGSFGRCRRSAPSLDEHADTDGRARLRLAAATGNPSSAARAASLSSKVAIAALYCSAL
ncbi:hypothetical protein I553_2432 [Mycobacterium xenopi 4042]|uniref:Uncharacterized protein n=1 Tax=Mycobacterium xenopi 4042 TaxID=1299334 RepID=X8C8X2_MYCXE|nr:hypothetical protein I553_2432 [Mycobacterium xenopi 4042]